MVIQTRLIWIQEFFKWYILQIVLREFYSPGGVCGLLVENFMISWHVHRHWITCEKTLCLIDWWWELRSVNNSWIIYDHWLTSRTTDQSSNGLERHSSAVLCLSAVTDSWNISAIVHCAVTPAVRLYGDRAVHSTRNLNSDEYVVLIEKRMSNRQAAFIFYIW